MLPDPWPKGLRISIEEEALLGYLKLKLGHGDLTEISSYITEISDFFDHDPWDLPGKTEMGRRNDKWYFFYRRTRKYSNGSCLNRSTPKGSWNETGNPKSANGKKRFFVFHKGSINKGSKTNWVLHEYESEDADADPEGYVVGCLMEKFEMRNKRKKTFDVDFGNNIASTSKNPVSGPKRSNVSGCQKEKSAKGVKIIDEVESNDNPTSAPNVCIPVHDFSSPTRSTLDHSQLQVFPNLVDDKAHQVNSPEKADQKSHNKELFLVQRMLNEQGASFMNIAGLNASPHDQYRLQNPFFTYTMGNRTTEVCSPGEADLGLLLLPIPINSEETGQPEFPKPCLFDKNETPHAGTTSELSNDDLMSSSLGNNLVDDFFNWEHYYSTDAIGGIPSNSK